MSHHGPQLYIPLSSLLLEADEVVDEGGETDEGESSDPDGTTGSASAGGDRRLCVTREASIRGVGQVKPSRAWFRFKRAIDYRDLPVWVAPP